MYKIFLYPIIISVFIHGIKMIIDLFLGGTNHTVIQAANGKEAQQKIERASPPIDLVVTDFSMPMMNGVELTLWIKKEYPEIPVILMSSDDFSRTNPADAFIQKPDGFDDFIATCDQLLSQGRRKHE